MVYKTSELSKGCLRKMVIRHAVIWWVMFVAIFYLLDMVRHGVSEAELHPLLLMFLVVPALAISLLGVRRMLRYRDQVEKMFYTLTEGGMMIETEKRDVAIFFPWVDVAMIRRSGNVVNVFTRGGRSFQCLLEGLSAERQNEFYRYAFERVGKGDPTQLTPPPAVEGEALELSFSATPQQRLEAATAQVLTMQRGRVQWFRPVVLLVWAVFLVYSVYRGDYIFSMLALAFLLSTAHRLWHPGGGRLQSIITPTEYFVTPQQLLCVKENGRWASFSKPEVKGACRMPHGVFYAFANYSVAMFDSNQPLPPYWPEPIGKLPRRLTGLPLLLVLGLALSAAVAALLQSPAWQLREALEGRGDVQAAALRFAGLRPDTEVADFYIHRLRKPSSRKALMDFCMSDALVYIQQTDGWVVIAKVSADGRILERHVSRYDDVVDDEPTSSEPTSDKETCGEDTEQ